MLTRHPLRLTVVVLALMAGLAFGQGLNPLKRGLMTVSGGVSWAQISFDGEDGGSLLSLTPSWGVFVTGNIQAIVGLDYTGFSPPEGDSWSSTALVVGGRYYLPLDFGPVYAGVLFNTISFSFEGAEAVNSLDIQAGYLKFFNDNLALDLGLAYDLGLGDNKTAILTLGGSAVVFFSLP